MEKSVPSSIQISEAIAMFLGQADRGEIPVQKRKAMIDLASEIWSASHFVYDIKSIHARICLNQMNAGEYRKSLMVDSGAIPRFYPRSCEIPRLVQNYFYPTYARVLANENLSSHRPDDVAWYLGALGRCIKPFYTENVSVFWLIENQLRVQFGLPVSGTIRSKSVFDEFRMGYFSKTFIESYLH